MKVLHITTTDVGGAGICCIRIHQSLLKQGIESKVLVEFPTRSVEEEYSYGAFKERLFRIPSKLLRMIGLTITERNKLVKLEKEYHVAYTRPVSPVDVTKHKLIAWADVIHLHFVNNYIDYKSFFGKVKKPIVWTLHDENLFYGFAHHHKYILKEHPLEIKYRHIKELSVKSCKNLTIVFLSNMMFQNFGNCRIIDKRRKVVINNSVDSHIYHSLDKTILREKYGLEKNGMYIVFVSMNIADPNKGLDLLSEVLLDTKPDAKVLAIGGNPLQKEWKNVKVMGLISDEKVMCEIINCADLYAMPSYQEAFSLSPLEAMLCGLPVVAFPVSGTSDLINEQNGIVCNGFTKSDLEDGIRQLLSRHYDANEIRKDIINRFSPEKIAEKYISLYREVIKQ